MLVDLIQTTTRDGLRLDGIFQPATGPAAFALDAIYLVHGTGGNFYGSTLFESIAEHFLPRGCAVLRANTRGHDGVSTASTGRGGKRLGAAYEIVDNCRHDLSAWISFLRDRGCKRICVIGHSLGAVKALYALTSEQNPCVKAIIGLSPPRLSYSYFVASAQGAEFLATISRAEALVASNQPATLMEVQQPLPYVITAGGYVEKYGSDERYNYLRFVSGVRCPCLITLGRLEVEKNMAFREAPEELARLREKYMNLQVETIPGADHFYSGVRGELTNCMQNWLMKCLAD